MNCKNCGKEVSAQAEVCNHCGARIATQQVNHEKGRSGRTLIFLALIIIVLSYLVLLLWAPNTPTHPPLTEEILPRNEMTVLLAPHCANYQKIVSNTPLILNYGYWGFLPEYAQQNLDNLIFEIYLDGELIGRQEKTFDLVATQTLPCADLSQFNSALLEKGQWAYTHIKHPGLPRGEYQVEIIFYLRARLTTGLPTEDGELQFFGPGEILKITKELGVE
jgi:hypothetical protein